MFEDHEFDELLQSVHRQLLPKLANVRQNWEFNHRPSDPPDEHMQLLLEFLEILKNHFGDNLSAAEIIEREARRANEWIAENTPEELTSKPRNIGKLEAPDKPRGTRSIFEDIDA